MKERISSKQMLSPEDTPPVSRSTLQDMDLFLAIEAHRPGNTKMDEMPSIRPVFNKKTGQLTSFGSQSKNDTGRRVHSMPVFPARMEESFKRLSDRQEGLPEVRRPQSPLTPPPPPPPKSSPRSASKAESPPVPEKDLVVKKTRNGVSKLKRLNPRAVSMFTNLDSYKSLFRMNHNPIQEQPNEDSHEIFHSCDDVNELPLISQPNKQHTGGSPTLAQPVRVFSEAEVNQHYPYSTVTDENSTSPFREHSFAQDQNLYPTEFVPRDLNRSPPYSALQHPNYATDHESSQHGYLDPATNYHNYYAMRDNSRQSHTLENNIREASPSPPTFENSPYSLAPPASSPITQYAASASTISLAQSDKEPLPPANSPISLQDSEAPYTLSDFDRLRSVRERAHKMEQNVYEVHRNNVGSIYSKATHVVIDDDDEDSLFSDMTFYSQNASSESERSEAQYQNAYHLKHSNSAVIANGILKVIKQYSASETSSILSKDFEEPGSEYFYNFDKDITSVYSSEGPLQYASYPDYADSLFSMESKVPEPAETTSTPMAQNISTSTSTSTLNKFKDLPVVPTTTESEELSYESPTLKREETSRNVPVKEPSRTVLIAEPLKKEILKELPPMTPPKPQESPKFSPSPKLINKPTLNNPKSRKNMKSYQNSKTTDRRSVGSTSELSDQSNSSHNTHASAKTVMSSLPESKKEMKAYARQRPFSFCLDGIGTDYSFSKYSVAGIKPKQRAVTTSNSGPSSSAKPGKLGPGGLPINATPFNTNSVKHSSYHKLQSPSSSEKRTEKTEAKPRAVSMFDNPAPRTTRFA